MEKANQLESFGVLKSFRPAFYRKRLVLFFGTSAATSLLVFILYQILFRPPDALFLLPPTIFMLGSLLLLFTKPSLMVLQILDVSVVALILFTLTFVNAHTGIKTSWEIIYGILLLWRAVIIPSRTAFQLALALAAFSAFILGKFSFAGSNSLAAVFKTEVMPGLILAILLALSVAVTRALYSAPPKSIFENEGFGNYKIIRELGMGGMGRVYEASHAFLCRPAAIKVMKMNPGGDLDGKIARFEQEIKLCATLSHPNTITIYDYGRFDENTFFYAMELLDGLDLQKLVERFGPVPAPRAIPILLQICSALCEAHEKGIIHRDIKPSNIFLSRQVGLYDFVKILDFGLAKNLREGENDLTQTGELLGTPRYIAPESVASNETIDHRTDIYMFGAVAYFMVTGKAPFDTGTSVEVIVDHLSTPPPKPSETSEIPIPEELEAIILKCLEKKQEDRFQNVTELAAALRKVPIDEEWTQEKSREWWKLHYPSGVAVLSA